MSQRTPSARFVNQDAEDCSVTVLVFKSNDLSAPVGHLYYDHSDDSYWKEDSLTPLDMGKLLLWSCNHNLFRTNFYLPYRYVDTEVSQHLRGLVSYRTEEPAAIALSYSIARNHMSAKQNFSLDLLEGQDFIARMKRIGWVTREDRIDTSKLEIRVDAITVALLDRLQRVEQFVLKCEEDGAELRLKADKVQAVGNRHRTESSALFVELQDISNQLERARGETSSQVEIATLLDAFGRANEIASQLRRLDVGRAMRSFASKGSAERWKEHRLALRKSINLSGELAALGRIFPVLDLIEVLDQGTDALKLSLPNGVIVTLTPTTIKLDGPTDLLQALVAGHQIATGQVEQAGMARKKIVRRASK
jgi:hypothetical protein